MTEDHNQVHKPCDIERDWNSHPSIHPSLGFIYTCHGDTTPTFKPHSLHLCPTAAKKRLNMHISVLTA